MSERWTANDVWALAPDGSSRKAATKIAHPDSWPRLGWRPAGPDTDAPGGAAAVWGECKGSGAKHYQVAVHLIGPGTPAYRCSCPSRKIPCKHVLALLVLWTEDVAAEDTGPDWLDEWLNQRAARAAAAKPAPQKTTKTSTDPDVVARRARQREQRVADGVVELDTWLIDQVSAGLATNRRDSTQRDGMAARLVDAQAGRLAHQLRSLNHVASEDDWPDRLLTEYALLHLLCVSYQRSDTLPAPLRATVRARIGFPLPEPEETVRDHWDVLGRCDFTADQVRGRRIWLRGQATGRTALLLSFAPKGRALDTPARVGTLLDAELAFYPAENRAVIATRYSEQRADTPRGGSIADALADAARALAADPWRDTWPVVLTDVTCVRGDVFWLTDSSGDALPLLRQDTKFGWQIFSVSGGHPVTVVAEWTPDGLRPLAVWDHRKHPILPA